MPFRFLIVTWEAGGGISPAIGLARLLAARNHEVRVLGPRGLQARVEAVGAQHCPYPEAAEYVAEAGVAMDDRRGFLEDTFFGDVLPAALQEELRRAAADVLVVDALLATTLSAAQVSGHPVAGLVHTLGRFHPRMGAWGTEATNAFRERLGLDLVDTTSSSVMAELLRRCDVELVALPAELDVRTDPAPNLVHVGPLSESAASGRPPELPWRPDDPRPLVVVSLSTTYMHQESLLQRILEALAGLPVRVLATTGSELDPQDLEVPAGIELRRFVSHESVLPSASLVVTHGGTGTVVAALAAGLPCICIPLGRDQHVTANTVAELGLGVALPTDATVSDIRDAAEQALASDELLKATQLIAAQIDAYGGGRRAVDVLEALAISSASGLRASGWEEVHPGASSMQSRGS